MKIHSLTGITLAWFVAIGCAFPIPCLARPPKTMKITSPDFAEGAMIPSRFTADGENGNPALEIEGVPENAKSLVLIVDDPDAPVGNWNHWLVWDIDPATGKIEKDSVPAGAIQGRNDFGNADYGGPAPPSGTHRYYFRLFALDAKLALAAGANRKALDKAVKGHVIAAAELMGCYSRGR